MLLVPQWEGSPHSYEGQARWRQREPLKITSPWRPSLALPGLYLFLGEVEPSLLNEKRKKPPRAQSGNAEHGGGRAVGLSGAWREQATSTIILFQN